MSDPNEHVFSRNDTIGPVQIDWVWDPMLQDREAWTCERLAKYDTIIIGGASHNVVKVQTTFPFGPGDIHSHHYTAEEYGMAMADVMRRIRNRPDCPRYVQPRVIWVGTPSRPPAARPRPAISDPMAEGACACSSRVD